MKKLTSLNDLFILKLSSLYDVEQQLVKALPKMAKAATDEELAENFQKHAEETAQHVVRLETVFKLLEIKPLKIKVDAIRGLIADAEWMVEQDAAEEVMDSALVGAAAYVEHYEMAGYITLGKWADLLGYPDISDVLAQTLEEEINAEEKMSMLAEERLDSSAMNVGADEATEK